MKMDGLMLRNGVAERRWQKGQVVRLVRCAEAMRNQWDGGGLAWPPHTSLAIFDFQISHKSTDKCKERGWK